MKGQYDIIIALDDNDDPVMVEALLDPSASTAVYPAKFKWMYISPTGGIGPRWYDCTAIDIGPSTFYLDMTYEEAVKL